MFVHTAATSTIGIHEQFRQWLGRSYGDGHGIDWNYVMENKENFTIPEFEVLLEDIIDDEAMQQ